MRRSRFTDEQIIQIFEAEAGAGTMELCRRYGIAKQTFYAWRAKYRGLGVSEAQRLRQLEDENRRLKHLVADLTLDNQALRAVLAKKPWRPPRAVRPRSSSGRSLASASVARAG